MSVEVGSQLKSADGQTFGIVTLSENDKGINAYLRIHGNEVALDVINIKSIMEILFGSLNKDQQKNMIKILMEESK